MLSVFARDSNGNNAAKSVRFTVGEGGSGGGGSGGGSGSQPPTITQFSYPMYCINDGSSVTVTFSASAPNGLKEARFYADGQLASKRQQCQQRENRDLENSHDYVLFGCLEHVLALQNICQCFKRYETVPLSEFLAHLHSLLNPSMDKREHRETHVQLKELIYSLFGIIPWIILMRSWRRSGMQLWAI